MTEGIINSDGSRNWEANILLDNVKRLEFELKVTKADYEASEQENKEEKKAYNECMHYLACMTEQRNKLKTALEEIREIIRTDCKRCTAECDCDDDCTRYKIENKINEVLN